MKKLLLCGGMLFVVCACLAQDSTMRMEARMREFSVLYQQRAAEYRALCYQAFNLASLRVDQYLRTKKAGARPVIITDLDETILDNSYQEAKLILDGAAYSKERWKEWSDKSAATSVPGAADFLREAHKKGITIFYISNRSVSELGTTLLNLQKLGLPDADSAHSLFADGTPSKESRRLAVMKKHPVVLLMGDNLNDFMKVFEEKSIADRFLETDKERAEWGKRFIVLPNAIYGEWENALYDYDKHLTTEQKEAKRQGKLISE
jgi:5'-nucleotidase (lipoprotein e(P4) family)